MTVNLPSLSYDVALVKPLSFDCNVQTDISNPIVLVPQLEYGETILVSESPVQVITTLEWFPNQSNITDDVFGRFVEHTLSNSNFFNDLLSKVVFSIHKSKNLCTLLESHSWITVYDD